MKFKDKDITKFNLSSIPVFDGCSEWIGGKDSRGYGMFYANGKTYKAHRVAYYLAKDNPTGLCVCHSCDNPSCVNPVHLFLGTIQDNNKDRHTKGRSKNKSTPGEAHTMAKLSNEDVLYIRSSLDCLQKDLASRYRVAVPTISNIQNRKTWKHLL
jgi:hypothetical protein